MHNVIRGWATRVHYLEIHKQPGTCEVDMDRYEIYKAVLKAFTFKRTFQVSKLGKKLDCMREITYTQDLNAVEVMRAICTDSTGVIRTSG